MTNKIEPLLVERWTRDLYPIKNNADVDRALGTALSDEQCEDAMHMTSSEDERANYGSDADIMMAIVKSEIKGLNAEEANLFYAERT